jgi:hypothetical protein
MRRGRQTARAIVNSMGRGCAALVTALLVGCAPSSDQSGWEIARKKNPAERLESFPEIPVVLPGSASASPSPPTGTVMEGVSKKALDVGSLFRRGYSAPTP